jgi:hypothetical protein
MNILKIPSKGRITENLLGYGCVKMFNRLTTRLKKIRSGITTEDIAWKFINDQKYRENYFSRKKEITENLQT